MSRKNLTAISIACAMLAAGLFSTRSQAFELVIDGEDELPLRYVLSVPGGPPEEINRELLRDAINVRLEVNPELQRQIANTEYVDLFGREDEILRTLDLAAFEDPVVQALASIHNGSGLAASMANLALSQVLVEVLCEMAGGDLVNQPFQVNLIMSKLRMHINPDLGASHLDIRTEKEIVCKFGDNEVLHPFTRRWVINILNGGIIGRKITNDPDGFGYRLYSVGIPIRMMAYYEYEKLVTRLDVAGVPDPRFRFYGVTNEACINVKLVDAPANDDEIESVAPNDIRFCAGGCGIPGIDATM